jgi:hypothetical protein
MAAIESLQNNNGNGGIGLTLSGVSTPSLPVSNPPQPLFDISVLSGLKPSDKYLGKNRVSDIQESYQTYLTGNPVGRGGQYAVDAAKKYGVSIVEAARGYLQGAGLPFISNATTQTTTQETIKTDNTSTTVQQKNPFEILADILPNLFGNAVYNPPLQSQAYGYSPTTTEQPLTSGGGGINIGLIVILGIIGVVAYFVYKRFAS